MARIRKLLALLAVLIAVMVAFSSVAHAEEWDDGGANIQPDIPVGDDPGDFYNNDQFDNEPIYEVEVIENVNQNHANNNQNQNVNHELNNQDYDYQENQDAETSSTTSYSYYTASTPLASAPIDQQEVLNGVDFSDVVVGNGEYLNQVELNSAPTRPNIQQSNNLGGIFDGEAGDASYSWILWIGIGSIVLALACAGVFVYLVFFHKGKAENEENLALEDKKSELNERRRRRNKFDLDEYNENPKEVRSLYVSPDSNEKEEQEEQYNPFDEENISISFEKPKIRSIDPESKIPGITPNNITSSDTTEMMNVVFGHNRRGKLADSRDDRARQARRDGARAKKALATHENSNVSRMKDEIAYENHANSENKVDFADVAQSAKNSENAINKNAQNVKHESENISPIKSQKQENQISQKEKKSRFISADSDEKVEVTNENAKVHNSEKSSINHVKDNGDSVTFKLVSDEKQHKKAKKQDENLQNSQAISAVVDASVDLAKMAAMESENFSSNISNAKSKNTEFKQVHRREISEMTSGHSFKLQSSSRDIKANESNKKPINAQNVINISEAQASSAEMIYENGASQARSKKERKAKNRVMPPVHEFNIPSQNPLLDVNENPNSNKNAHDLELLRLDDNKNENAHVPEAVAFPSVPNEELKKLPKSGNTIAFDAVDKANEKAQSEEIEETNVKNSVPSVAPFAPFKSEKLKDFPEEALGDKVAKQYEEKNINSFSDPKKKPFDQISPLHEDRFKGIKQNSKKKNKTPDNYNDTGEHAVDDINWDRFYGDHDKLV